MKESRSWITPKQAADIAGVTTRTINNYITSGKLSASREDNRYYIDKSEFFRVFPNCMLKKSVGNFENSSENKDSIASEIEIQYLKEALLDKEKQNDFLKQLVESYTNDKSMMIQTINIHSKMLEHKQEAKEKELITNDRKRQKITTSDIKKTILKLFKRGE